MSPEEIRLKCLELARPDNLQDPDSRLIVARAEVYEAFVTGKAGGRQTRKGPTRK